MAATSEDTQPSGITPGGIVGFLLARIADDEATHLVYGYLLNVEHHETGCMELAAVERCDAQCDCDGPRRWLAECQAKRAIVDDHDTVHECPGGKNLVSDPDLEDGSYGGPCATLRHLAAVYADHPDYDESWRP